MTCNAGRKQPLLFSNQMTHCLEQVLNISDTVRFRVYEVGDLPTNVLLIFDFFQLTKINFENIALITF